MRRSWRIVSVPAMVALSMLVAAGCGGTWTRQPPPERALDHILPSSVQIVLEQQEGRLFRSGSGVVIGARRAGGRVDCFILTSGHTFAGAGRGKNIYVLSRRHEGLGVRTPATLLAVSETDGIDLALLGTRSQDCSVASVGKPAHLGETVWVVSFPWGRELTVSRGVISQVRRAAVGASLAGGAGGAGRLMVDAPVSYGASGGGVFRASSGELVGLVDGYPTARVAFEGVSVPAHIDVPVPGQTYLTPIGDAMEFLRGSGHAPLIAKGTAAPG